MRINNKTKKCQQFNICKKSIYAHISEDGDDMAKFQTNAQKLPSDQHQPSDNFAPNTADRRECILPPALHYYLPPICSRITTNKNTNTNTNTNTADRLECILPSALQYYLPQFAHR